MESREKPRKCYIKPQINQVMLKIEEAVLAGCKTGAGAPGVTNKNCDHAQCKRSVYGS